MIGVQVCSCTSDSVILASSLVCAVTALADIKTLRILIVASETWNVAIDIVDIVPPFPMTINLIFEPDVSAPSECNISFPWAVEVLFNHCISSVNKGLRRHWYCCIHFPGIGMCSALALGGWETKLNGFWESGASKSRNASCNADCWGTLDTFGDWPWTHSWCTGWFSESEGSWLIQTIAVVLREYETGLSDSLDDTVLQLRDVDDIQLPLWPVSILDLI